MTDARPGRAAWSELSAAGGRRAESNWRVAKSFVAVSGEDVLYAEDPNGLRHLLVPYPEGAADFADTRSAGVQLLTRVLEDSRGRHRFLDVACCKEHLFGIFQHFAEDLLESLRADEGDVARACANVLSRWRELLDPHATHLLSIQALAGLYGELLQLRELHALNAAALATWKGPLGARHDFVTAGAAIEVKSILARDGWRVRIHGLTQLDADAGQILLLRTYRLELNGMFGQTVPELIGDLVDAGVNRTELFSLVLAIGYSASDDAHYGRQRFRVVEERSQLVTEQTPRIVPASFLAGRPPQGVEDVEYTIDLAASSDEALSQEEIRETLKAFAEGASYATRP